MSDTHRASYANRTVIARLEDENCRDCDGGTLETAMYKGDVALVCDGCGTPRARFWDLEREAIELTADTERVRSASPDR